MYNDKMMMENLYGYNMEMNNMNGMTPQTKNDFSDMLKNFNNLESNMKNNNQYQNNNQNHSNNQSLYNPKEGFTKGNLFSNIYEPYKNYKPAQLRPRNDRERLLIELSEAGFAAHELNLYLDVHPEDESMIALFNDYRSKSGKLATEYQNKYGPLTVSSDALNTSPWMWTVDTWPWEGSDS